MDLTAYLHPGWAPLIRPAPATRAWMDATPESFAYRCLPLNIANSHGWEVLSPCAFDAVWHGGSGTDSVLVKLPADADPQRAPVSLFGQGTVTFHIEAIFRTPPGWNLWVGGSPNRPKDGIAPLTGVIETDWSPFTFTMNWRFTRPGHWIHFDRLEPFCFLFPLPRAAVEAFQPAFAPLGSDPETETRFHAWSAARNAFHQQMQRQPPKAPADRWQKHYYRGVDTSGQPQIADHRSKLRLKAFDRSATPDVPIPPLDDAALLTEIPARAPSEELAQLKLALAKREWLLETLERQRDLAPVTVEIERCAGMTPEEFLECYYSTGRPVVLAGEMRDWPALKRWTPEYLKETIGTAPVEYQGGRTANANFEVEKDRHRRETPFNALIDSITGSAGNDAYITAYNSARNRETLAPLAHDMGFLDKFLTRQQSGPDGMMWIGPAGTFTPLHHDLTNNLIAQLVGRKQVKLVPASETGKIYNHRHVFSEISDLDDPTIDMTRFPRLPGLRVYEVTLAAGEILFVPFAWWHQVRALDFSVTVTYTNFRWPNEAYKTYPSG
jgi:hypothetical protein